VFGIGLDQISKYFAVQNLLFGVPTAMFPFLNWTLNYNKGISFGLFNQYETIVPILLLVIVAALIIGLFVWLWKLPGGLSWQAVSLSLIIGGAIGNLIDRVTLGHVVDFIDVYVGNWHWYTFNIADALICIGAGILALKSQTI
jgi:signal peptidase II